MKKISGLLFVLFLGFNVSAFEIKAVSHGIHNSYKYDSIELKKGLENGTMNLYEKYFNVSKGLLYLIIDTPLEKDIIVGYYDYKSDRIHFSDYNLSVEKIFTQDASNTLYEIMQTWISKVEK